MRTAAGESHHSRGLPHCRMHIFSCPYKRPHMPVSLLYLPSSLCTYTHTHYTHTHLTHTYTPLHTHTWVRYGCCHHPPHTPVIQPCILTPSGFQHAVCHCGGGNAYHWHAKHGENRTTFNLSMCHGSKPHWRADATRWRRIHLVLCRILLGFMPRRRRRHLPRTKHVPFSARCWRLPRRARLEDGFLAGGLP